MTAPDSLAQEKQSLINKCLDDDHVLIHLDSRSTGVELPSPLLAQPMVTLKLSKLFKGGVEVQADKIIADLLFDHGYALCSIPLAAVWGVTSAAGKNFVWPQSTPVEVLNRQLKLDLTKKTPEKAAAKKETKTGGAASGHLKRVK